MAPVTIKTAARGWYEGSASASWTARVLCDTGTVLYAVVQDSTAGTPKVRVMKADSRTAPTTWTEQDSANNKAINNVNSPFSSWYNSVNGTIYVFCLTGTNTGAVYPFVVSTDLWGTEIAAGTHPTDVETEHPIRIVTRSDNDILLAWTSVGDDADVSSSRYEGATWTNTGGGWNSATSGAATMVADMVIDSTDRAFAFMYDTAPGFKYRSWNSANTFGTATNIDATANTNANGARFNMYVDGTTDKVIAAYIDNGGSLKESVITLESDSAGGNIAANVSIEATTTDVGTRTPVSTAMVGSTPYAVWWDDASSGTIYYSTKTAGAWAVKTSWKTGITRLIEVVPIGVGLVAVYQSSTDVIMDFIVPAVADTPKNDTDTVAPTLSEAETLAVASPETDTIAPALTEAQNIDKNLNQTDTVAPTATEVETLTVSLAETDTIAPTLSESDTVARLILKADTDTVAPTLSEAETLAVAAVDTDTVTATLTEAETLTIELSDTETVTATLTEAETIDATLADTETIEPTLSEAETIDIVPGVVPVDDTDEIAPTLAEAESLTAALADTDTITPTLAEADTLAAALTESDTAAPTLTEVESLAVAAADTETLTATLVETDAVAAILADTETIAPTLTEAETVALQLYRDDTDTISPTISEADTVEKTQAVDNTDTITSTFTEADTLVVAALDTDTVTPTSDEAETLTVSLTDTDTLTCTLTEVVSIVVVVGETDTLTVDVGEAEALSAEAVDTDDVTATLTETETVEIVLHPPGDITAQLLVAPALSAMLQVVQSMTARTATGTTLGAQTTTDTTISGRTQDALTISGRLEQDYGQ
jgi:hypothetical protein